MTQSAENTIRDMVIETSAAAEVLEQLDIDYFCRGNRSLREALDEKGVSMEDFTRERERVCRQRPCGPAVPDWRTVPLRILIDFIVNTHHAFLHRELPVLDRCIAAHHAGSEHVWLPALRQMFHHLQKDMEVHMRKEESILFPTIADMETAMAAGRTPLSLPFGSVANFSRVLEQEHRQTAGVLQEIRVLTNNYTCPPRASEDLRMLFRRMQILVADVHRHIHLENNILFPRAIDLERGESLCR